MLIHLERLINIIHQLSRDIHTSPRSLSLYMAVTLESLIPITEEHTKLLDHLSEPLSVLIHHISHPLEEDISAEVVTLSFNCIQVHSFLLSVKGSLCHNYC